VTDPHAPPFGLATATRPRKPPRTLTPATVTARYPSLRTGRLEGWSAVSDDGVWKYERLEEPRTPWSTVHVPSGIEAGSWAGTLSEAREMTANGSALADIERQMAHQRGEHAQPDPQCVRC
jgi:hypothetical protein